MFRTEQFQRFSFYHAEPYIRTNDVLLCLVVKRHGLHLHCYADDIQIYGFCEPSDVDALQQRLSVCIDEVFTWMMSNRLQLNPAKTGSLVFICSCTCGQLQLSSLNFAQVFPNNSHDGCSLSLTPPLVSCSRRGSQST